MSKPTIKKITQKEEPEGETCIYYLNYNEDRSQITLMVSASRPMSPVEYLGTLANFLNDVEEFPDSLFVENVDNEHLN